MRPGPGLDSRKFSAGASRYKTKTLRLSSCQTLFLPAKCGCSSVVEHLLAKEDVASSSLVTRSSPRLERSTKRRLERCAVALREDGPAKKPKLRLASQPFDALRLVLKVARNPRGHRIPYYENNIALPVCACCRSSLRWGLSSSCK